MRKKLTKIASFTDLITWQKGHKLVLAVYHVTESFPTNEKFGLTSQMRRSAVSITSNIAEGFNRRTGSDKRHFFVMAKSSLTELQNQLLIAKDLKLISKKAFIQLAEQTVEISKLLVGLMRSACKD